MTAFSSLLHQSMKWAALLETWLHGFFRRSNFPRLPYYHPLTGSPLHTPKLITPIPYRDAHIQTSSGDEVHVRVWFSEGRDPQSPLHEASVILVFVPEAPVFVQHVNYVACDYVSHPKLLELAEKRRSEGHGDGSIVLVACDMPGSGYSYASRQYRYTAEEGGHIILQVLDTLKVLNHHYHLPKNIDLGKEGNDEIERERHDKKVIMIGTSVTGFYTMEAARKKPSTFELLVLSQTPSVVALKQWYRSNYPFFLRVPIIGQIISFFNESLFGFMHFRNALPRATAAEHSPLVKPFTATTLDVILSGGCHCLSSIIQGISESWKVENERFKPYVPEDVPVLGVWGCSDRSHELARTEETTLLTDVEHAKVTTIKEVGHLAPFEVPNVIIELILQGINPPVDVPVTEEKFTEDNSMSHEEVSRVEELVDSDSTKEGPAI